MKRFLCIVFCLFPHSRLKIFLLKFLGYKVDYKSRIGISFISVNSLELDQSKIGNFNWIHVNTIKLDQYSEIGRMNIIKGPIDVRLGASSAVGRLNKIYRAWPNSGLVESQFELGIWSKITVDHYLDCTRSIRFGDYSTLAGRSSQLWTHGYFHSEEGLDRIRIDGKIYIGNNVYIGSSCFFNPGVNVTDSVHIGGNSAISKNISAPGMYVNAPLRKIDINYAGIKSKFSKDMVEHNNEKIGLKN